MPTISINSFSYFHPYIQWDIHKGRGCKRTVLEDLAYSFSNIPFRWEIWCCLGKRPSPGIKQLIILWASWVKRRSCDTNLIKKLYTERNSQVSIWKNSLIQTPNSILTRAVAALIIAILEAVSLCANKWLILNRIINVGQKYWWEQLQHW